MGFFNVLPYLNPITAIPALTADAIDGSIPGTRSPGEILGMQPDYVATPGIRPMDPSYRPGYDPLTMGTSQEMDRRLAGIGDTRGLNRYRGEAMRTGPSAWAQLANRQQDAQGLQARQDAAKGAAGGAAEARAQLAMRGGLNSGARERVAKDAARSQLAMGQQVGQQVGANKLQIGMNDEQNRISMLGALPGMDIAQGGADLNKLKTYGASRQFDIGNQVGEADRRNQFEMDRYKEGMAAWGANQQANAIGMAGNKKGLFGSIFG